MTGSTLYVYAVIPADSPAPGITGIDEAELDIVTAPPLAAVVHTHHSSPYEGPDDDVKRWVLQHSDVIEDSWTHAKSVLPVSFNVIVRPSEETEATATQQLQDWLSSSAQELTEKLEKLAGTSELRVEITLDPHEFSQDQSSLDELRAEIDAKPPGVRRLLEKRLDKLEKQLTDQSADEVYPEYRSRIASHCLQIQEYAPSRRAKDAVVVLSAACLVESAYISDLGAELSRIQEESPTAQIRFLGPWPPYSFVDLADPGPDRAEDSDQQFSDRPH